MKIKDSYGYEYASFQTFVGECHDRYANVDVTVSGRAEVYVKSVDYPKAYYHGEYGLPADIGKVWEDREKLFENNCK